MTFNKLICVYFELIIIVKKKLLKRKFGINLDKMKEIEIILHYNRSSNK